MNALRRAFSLPLLIKELTESAARWRTFALRVGFALGLYTLVGLLIPARFWAPGAALSSWSLLGMGREIYEALIIVESVGIALFLPAMMCGCITHEKERDSLVLLLLTELRPWQILLQKYLGGIVPVLSFVLLSGPLMAIAYSLGGIASEKLVWQAVALVLHVLLLGALTLLCSVWCRSTVSALLTTYFAGTVLYTAPAFVAYLARSRSWADDRTLAFLFVPTAQIELIRSNGPGLAPLYLLPTLLLTLGLLILARVFFLRRAFLPPAHFLPRLFRRIDAAMQRANRITGGTIVLAAGDGLPGDQPIYWRETTRRGLGRLNHLLRLFVVIQSLTILLCLFMAINLGEAFEPIMTIAWALAILTTAVQGANVIVSERVTQTLDVLLTTQLSSAQILREKERALFRFLLLLAIPLLTIVGVHSSFGFCGLSGTPRETAQFLGCWCLMILVHLPLTAWLSMTIGVWLRTRFRAIMVSLIALVSWHLLPLLAFNAFENYRGVPLALLLSPIGIIFYLDDPRTVEGVVGPTQQTLVLIANFAFHSAFAFLLRWQLFRNSDRWLRR